MRLLHGLSASSSWVDPKSPEFNADRLVREFERWENEPFVKFVLHVQRCPAEAAFIAERVAALKLWAESSDYQAILNRSKPAEEGLLLSIKLIGVEGIAPEDSPAKPYVIVYDGN